MVNPRSSYSNNLNGRSFVALAGATPRPLDEYAGQKRATCGGSSGICLFVKKSGMQNNKLLSWCREKYVDVRHAVALSGVPIGAIDDVMRF